MIEEVKYSGEWWIPTHPEKRIKGKFHFNQAEGAILELEESLPELSTTILGSSLVIGRPITLQDCIAKRPDQFWEGTFGTPYKVFANRTYIGAHFSCPEDVKFKSFHCHLSNLFEWLWKYGVTSENKGNKEITIKYNRPESISIIVSPELRVSIDFGCSYSQKHKNAEIKLEQSASVAFYPKEAENVEKYLTWMHHFRNFLCLATQETTNPQELNGLTEDSSPSSLVQVLYKLDAPINTDADVYDSLFTFKDIESNFGQMIQNWYLKFDTLEPLYQLYFGSNFGRFVYLNLKFLCLVQALEAYHRRVIANSEISQEEHLKRITNILSSAPSEHKEWLQNELRYANEPSLRSRLKDLYAIFSSTVDNLMPEKKDLIQKVVDIRNYMTHYDLNLKDRYVSGRELFIIIEKLRILVEMCLLKEIGFDPKEINNMIIKRYQDRLKLYEQ